MPEGLKTRLFRYGFNIFPAYRGTGGRVTYISDDWMNVRIRLPLNWRTRNYVGTIYGGSISGSIDPIYRLMLMKILGPGYTVWDKAASIRFKKPGRETLYAEFVLDDEEIGDAKIGVIQRGKGPRKPGFSSGTEDDLVPGARIVMAKVRSDEITKIKVFLPKVKPCSDEGPTEPTQTDTAASPIVLTPTAAGEGRAG